MPTLVMWSMTHSRMRKEFHRGIYPLKYNNTGWNMRDPMNKCDPRESI